MASQGAAAVAKHGLVIFSTHSHDLAILTALAEAAGRAAMVAAAVEVEDIAAAMSAETSPSSDRLVLIDTRLAKGAAERVLTRLRGASVAGSMIALVPHSAQLSGDQVRASGYDDFLATPLSPSQVRRLFTGAAGP